MLELHSGDAEIPKKLTIWKQTILLNGFNERLWIFVRWKDNKVYEI